MVGSFRGVRVGTPSKLAGKTTYVRYRYSTHTSILLCSDLIGTGSLYTPFAIKEQRLHFCKGFGQNRERGKLIARLDSRRRGCDVVIADVVPPRRLKLGKR